MASSLIASLNANAHLTPDQIVTQLSDPFSTWGQGGRVTHEHLRRYAEMRIVICYIGNRHRPRTNSEMDHKLGTIDGAGTYSVWTYEDYHDENGTLRDGGNFWFRSLASFEANPYDTF